MDITKVSTIKKPLFKVSNFLSAESQDGLIDEIYAGLTAGQKYISSQFFYDDTGSSLFEEITALPEYYPTRTEKSILKDNAKEILANFEQPDILELGSGDCSKISILLDNIPEQKIKNVSYSPVDVSKSAILKSAEILSLKYKGIKIHGFLADFMKHFSLQPSNKRRLICFLGSTLGNLNKEQSEAFLVNIAGQMKPGDKFLLGVDMVKDTDVLIPAYNDKQGITASFNKNMLNVINEIAKTNFNPELFDHHAFFNESESRMEMHLKASTNMTITSEFFPSEIRLARGETIHTENSRKYTREDIFRMATTSGLKIERIFTDKLKWFSLIQFKCNG